MIRSLAISRFSERAPNVNGPDDVTMEHSLEDKSQGCGNSLESTMRGLEISSVSLATLPTELLCEIASHVPLEDCLNLRNTYNRAIITKTSAAFAKTAFRDNPAWKRRWLCPSTINVLEQVAAQPGFAPYVTTLDLDILLPSGVSFHMGSRDSERALKKQRLRKVHWKRLENAFQNLTALQTLRIKGMHVNSEDVYGIYPRQYKFSIPCPVLKEYFDPEQWHVSSDRINALEDKMANRFFRAALTSGATQIREIMMRLPRANFPSGMMNNLRKLVLLDVQTTNDKLQAIFVREFNKIMRDNRSLRILHIVGSAHLFNEGPRLTELQWPQELKELELVNMNITCEILSFIEHLPLTLELLSLWRIWIRDHPLISDDWMKTFERVLHEREHRVRLRKLTFGTGLIPCALRCNKPDEAVQGVLYIGLDDTPESVAVVEEECDGQDLVAWLHDLGKRVAPDTRPRIPDTMEE